MDDELIRRITDLASRCSRSASVTHTGFLTPAEAFRIEHWSPSGMNCGMLLHGGVDSAERRVAFFLPEWMDEDSFDIGEYLCALEFTARFGSPGHRDYLGAALALGIGREWIGDIYVNGERAWLLCMLSQKQNLLLNLDRVGRWGVRAREVSFTDIQKPEKKYTERIFSVKSPRLDAICAGMFGVSRSVAVEAVSAGLVTLNYCICIKPDMPVREGDVLSLRGKGKGEVLDAGSHSSQKGRLFIKIGLYR